MVLKYSKFKQLIIIDSFFLTNRINDLIYHICLYYVSLLHAFIAQVQIVAIIVPNFATNTTCKYANC